MARLYLPPQVFDSNGNPLSGAVYQFFDAAAHSTPKTAYPTNALTSGFTSLTADAAGRFTEAYAELNEAFYVVLKNSSGTIIQAWDNFTALGPNATGSITQTFSDARWKISSGLVDGVNQGVNDESGFLSPTNTGGYRRIGGWALSQGNGLTLDFATINTTGILTENSKKLQGVVYTARTPFSAAATVDIALPNQPAGVIAWSVEVYELVVSTDGNLNVLFSTDGASFSGSTTLVTGIDAAGADQPGRLALCVITNTGTKRTEITGAAYTYVTGTGAPGPAHVMAVSAASFGRCTHIRLSPAAGTISGAYRVVPLRGYE